VSTEQQGIDSVKQTSCNPRESLASELDVWRKTPFDRLVVRRWHPPVLTAAIARASQASASAVRVLHVRAVLIAVVTAAEKQHFAGTPPRGEGAISSPAVIREIFGLTRDSKNATARQRQELAGHAVGRGISWHTIRKYNQAYVDQLVTWTLDYLDGLDSQPVAVSKSKEQTAFIDRQDDLDWLLTTHRQLVASGGLFLLWGLIGSGKTTLAQQFATQVAPEKFVGFIRLGRRGLYEEDIRRILQTEGHDTSSWSDAHCQALFRTAARKLSTIRLLILDDARSESDISALIPDGSIVPVLVTTRERLRVTRLPSNTQPPARQLFPLTTEKSETFLRNQIPGLDAITASELAKILGGHAETMHHVVRYLTTNDAMSPEILLEELGRSTHRTLADLTEVLEVPSGLPLIVKQLYCQLADDPFSNAILTSIIWTNSSGEQPRDLIIEVVSELLHRPSALELHAAMHRLERLSLLTRSDTSLALSRLTCQILRDLLIYTREPVLVAYERVIAAPVTGTKLTNLVQILRQEYDFLRSLRPILVEALGTVQAPPPALVALDDSNWALFTTSSTGRRQVEMYRTTPHTLLRLRPGAAGWDKTTGDDASRIIELTSGVYPTIKAGWQRIKDAHKDPED
jgi:hypothetical protein